MKGYKKKVILLFCFLNSLFTSFQTKANYTDFFRVYYQGIELSPGETIYCHEYEAIEKNGKISYYYETSLNIINQLPISNINWAQLTFCGNPTQEEANLDKNFWGSLALCYWGGDENGEMASCMTPSGSAVRIPNNDYDCFEWHPQLQGVSPECVSEYKFILKAASGELQWGNYTIEENSDFFVTIVFSPQESASIKENSLQVSTTPIYFDLNGNIVKNPGKGLYLVKTGNTISKVFISD